MSAMFTTCPNCKLHLAVTPLDLRVGQGYVRCGRCDKVFNALLSLAEDVEKPSGVATGTTTVPALEDERQADALLEMPPASSTASRPQPASEPEPAPPP